VTPYFAQDGVTLYHGDCREILQGLPDESVSAVVTDPPYGLSFMGKKWDYDVPAVEVWAECLRVLKPGGHLLAFAGTRTQHRMAVRIEDAGFEIRDMIAWVYGSGFPKSLDVSKAIDRAAGAEGSRGPMKRGGERLARLEDGKRDGEGRWGDEAGRDPYTYLPFTPEAQQWAGWGTSLKPALEPITVARKPLIGTVAENVLARGTGGINVDGCRVGTDGGTKAVNHAKKEDGRLQRWDEGYRGGRNEIEQINAGRWPANLIHDGSDEVTALLGEAARFFYTAKADKADRGPGNNHPTVKPVDLMRYLVRLVCPIGGVVLDPFSGSGTTLAAAQAEGCLAIGVEREAAYCEIIKGRFHQRRLF
jgi:DNA modification methylase